MKKRIDVNELQPQAFKAMYGLVGYLQTASIDKTDMELIKIRASQLNGCAYCIDMHTKYALEHGETAQRIFMLNAWRESSWFSDREKVVLAMTEEITLIHQHGLSEATYNKAEQFFSGEQIAQLIMAIAVINTWNRIAISTNKEPDA